MFPLKKVGTSKNSASQDIWVKDQVITWCYQSNVNGWFCKNTIKISQCYQSFSRLSFPCGLLWNCTINKHFTACCFYGDHTLSSTGAECVPPSYLTHGADLFIHQFALVIGGGCVIAPYAWTEG